LIICFSNAAVFANTRVIYFENISLITAPPKVYSPVTYWQNCTKPLVAIASPGATLNWYTTNLPTEIPSTVPPSPNTSTIGVATATYYVSQTIGSIASIRVPIVVNVAADNGTANLPMRCDPSQIIASDKYSSVFYDWGNVPGNPTAYNVSYSIQGGPFVTESTVPSHWQIFGMLPGQSAILTYTNAALPCIPAQTLTCTVPCLTTTTPLFTSTPIRYCLNDVAVLPTTSTNAITGTWSPSSTVNTSAMGTVDYTFTPDPILFPCAIPATLSVTIGPIQPDFSDFAICSRDAVLTLSTVSPNGIDGTWSPTAIVDPALLPIGITRFTFTPDGLDPCTPVTATKTIDVTVNISNTILGMDWTVTTAFTKNQIVTITNPVGANYVYQMDSGPLQVSPVFQYVASGVHSFAVKDINGCSEFIDNNVLVIGYPKYFTPNGDTYNDTWNIKGLVAISPKSRIYIFDRYGKLLKDISPNDSGWDGTFVGQAMPPDDYWFTVEYVEDSGIKKFRSHFSLKR
jgi:gliding motility-associated-like protein